MGKRKLLYLSQGQSRPVAPEKLEDHWEVHTARNVSQACSLAARDDFRVGLLILDGASAPPASCEELILAAPQSAWVAALPAEALERSDYRNLIGQGFFDFHTLPADYPLLNSLLGHAYGMARLRDSAATPGTLNRDYHIVGSSPAIKRALNSLYKMAATDAPVLIRGESGTGKELAARAIHLQSSRADQPFVAINCGALPPSLIQSELFGYERGAFTGANRRKIGRIESAAGGTVFLDEIGDLPLELQVNLLRFLEENAIERVGGHVPIPLDVRVIAATHVDLEKAVADNRFREDLYYRLNVLNLTMPPLRDRIEDIEALAHYYFNRFSGERNLSVKGFSRNAIEVMGQYPWPGNVRELINRIRRAMVMCERRLITPSELGLDRDQVYHPTSLKEARDDAEKQAITTSLRRTSNNISMAAKNLGISRLTLYRLLDKHHMRP